MSERRKKEPSMFRAMLADRGIKDMQGIHELVKELCGSNTGSVRC